MFDGQKQKHKSTANFCFILFFLCVLCINLPNLEHKIDLFHSSIVENIDVCPGLNGRTLNRFLTCTFFPPDNAMLLINAH